MSEVEKIPIEEAAIQAGYKSIRGFKTWCRKNNILIFKSGKKWNVLRVEFEAARDKEFIIELKRIYGDKWDEMYETYLSKDRPSVIKNLPQKSGKSYMRSVPPTSDVGKAFLDKAKRA